MTSASFPLTRRFVIAGMLAIGTFSAAMAWVLSDFIEQRLLTRDAAVGRDFVQSIVTTQDVAEALRSGDPRRSPGFNEFFAHLAAMPDVLRANVYTPDRQVLWSSRPEIIGLRFPGNPELEEALRDQVIVHVTSHPEEEAKAEHVLLESSARQYIENYVPVHDTHRHVIGVVELYRRPVALFEAIRSGQQLVWLGALLGGAFLFACLIGFVRHTERALHAQQRRLVEADALALVGEIAASVAHSIRNPLGAIRSSAELQREIDGDPQGVQAQIMRDADRIEALVRTMLTHAGTALDPEGQAPARTDLDEVLDALAQRLAPELAQQDRHFEADLPAALGHVAVSPVLLTQALRSLITNACEATAPGGCIRLQARRRRREVTIEITDDGVGMDPILSDTMIRPFHTTKPRGFGMGLALVRRIADRAGGHLHISSRRERGTTVVLHLPSADDTIPDTPRSRPA